MYSDVYEYWFNSEIKNLQRHWIPINEKKKKNKLNEIESRFLDIYFQCLFKILSAGDNFYSELAIQDKIGFIIILDQFTRTLGEKYPNINKYKSICTKLVYVLIHKDFIENKNYLFLLPNELLFVLMVYKHMSYNYFNVIHDTVSAFCTFNNVKITDKSCNNLLHFYIDFYEKYVFSLFPTINDMDITNNISYKIIDNIKISEVCDQTGYLPKDFVNQLYDFSLIDTLDKIIYNIFNDNIFNDNIFNDNIQKRCVCVSLSGGVDSMVLTYILKKMETLLNINIKVFHLSYNNRTESQYERQLIWTFCQKLNIPIYNYTIPYLKRGDINREKYEKITRKIRFKCYEKMSCPIILGHIYEDKVENIFTNLSTNKHIFNLQKIKLISEIQGISIIRPFINTEKADIFKYAHICKIPYLNDTTPLWSNRGKFRTNFINHYIKQYDKGISNIVKVSESLQNYGELIQETVIQPMITDLLEDKWIIITPSIRKNKHLIRELFTGYCHSIQHGMPSEKSIQGLVSILSKNTERNKYQLSKYILLDVFINKIKVSNTNHNH